MAGQAAGSPFPGHSLARFWDGTMPAAPPGRCILRSRAGRGGPEPERPGNRDSAGLPKPTWPLGALNEAEWSYIRREGDVREELFHLREDAKEERNLAARSGRAADARADARRPGPDHGRAALAGTVPSLTFTAVANLGLDCVRCVICVNLWPYSYRRIGDRKRVRPQM